MDLDAFYADIYDMVDDIPTSSQPSQHDFGGAVRGVRQGGGGGAGHLHLHRPVGNLRRRGAGRTRGEVPQHRLRLHAHRLHVVRLRRGLAGLRRGGGPRRRRRPCGLHEGGAGRHGVHALPVHAREPRRSCRKAAASAARRRFWATSSSCRRCSRCATGRRPRSRRCARARRRSTRSCRRSRPIVEAYGLKRVMVHYIGDPNPAVAWAREVDRAVGGACGGRAAGQPRHRIARGARRGHRLQSAPAR